jgi:hypothetical protein
LQAGFACRLRVALRTYRREKTREGPQGSQKTREGPQGNEAQSVDGGGFLLFN